MLSLAHPWMGSFFKKIMLEFNPYKSPYFMFSNLTFSLVETRIEVGVNIAGTGLPIVHFLSILTISFSTQLQSSSLLSHWKENSISFTFHITWSLIRSLTPLKPNSNWTMCIELQLFGDLSLLPLLNSTKHYSTLSPLSNPTLPPLSNSAKCYSTLLLVPNSAKH